jgi:glycosyltransferase involved in cell wall biosynthesis
MLHDAIVARRLRRLADQIDVVHTWPLGARRTLQTAAKLGIPTVLERPNAHTRLAYEAVRAECDRLGIELPPDHEHAYKEDILHREEEEYALADYLLCPSEFVERTFRDEGYPEEKLLRHQYGFDPKIFYSPEKPRPTRPGLTMLIVGVAAVRKGQHFALEAWLRSTASESGRLLIAGEFLPAYRERLAPLLADPSVVVLGHRNDVPDLMRASDVFVLPSIEEGSALACTEALASGCVPLVSDVCRDPCRHMENALIHAVGDVDTLSEQMSAVHEDRMILERLRAGAITTATEATWEKAGISLFAAYGRAVGVAPITGLQAAAESDPASEIGTAEFGRARPE